MFRLQNAKEEVAEMKQTHMHANIKIFLLFTIMFFVILPSASHVFAQCRPLTTGVCVDTLQISTDFSFNQNIGYWMAVGVVPTVPDDKDIYLFTACPAGGSYLAGSSGVNGADFIVGDFNHNTYGSYYPHVQYGSVTDPYTVFWTQGGKILPVSAPLQYLVGGTAGSCFLFDVWDVYLEGGAQYEFRFSEPVAGEAHLALFRNPGSTTYWTGRASSEFELTGTDATQIYTAPASDWYGVVAFPTWRQATDTYSIEVEKLFDCHPLTSEVCEAHSLYQSSGVGPKGDYSFDQVQFYWSVVAVVPKETDNKALAIYTECDEHGANLGTSMEGMGETSFIVTDFTHTPLSTYCPVVFNGSMDDSFTIEWEEGSVLFPIPSMTIGSFGGMSGNPNVVDVWDMYLQAGKEYEFFFYEYGDADPHLAFFRNCSTTDYWAPRSFADWEINGGGYQNYTAPTTDYCALVAFADAREKSGFYQIQIQELNDCIPLAPMACTKSALWPRDYSFQTTGNYWAAVAIFPGETDDKDLYVTTQCDQKGSLLATSTSGGSDFVVGDFNHMTPGTYYASSYTGDPFMEYLVSCDVGANVDEDIFPMNEAVAGGMVPGEGDCLRIKIWDVFLESGQSYTASFTRSGTADIRLAMFHNPGSGTFWAGRNASEWEMSESGNMSYTAPASDWYGLVVFANDKEGAGTYTIRITPTGMTAVGTVPLTPERFALYQNTPNPFNPSTFIRYDVPSDGLPVSLCIYDVQGRLVRNLLRGVQSAGEKSIAWDGRGDNGNLMSTGIYFYRLEAAGYSETRKMLLIK
jgi:hypothetical protein